MPIPKFALLTLDTTEYQFKAPKEGNPPQSVEGRHGWAKSLLENAADYCVRIGFGTFILKTQEGWPVIQALLKGFEGNSEPISLVLFEQDLIGNFPIDALPKLQQLGVAVYSISLPQSLPK